MTLCLLFVALLSPLLALADSGSGTTTRYWDCCKPSCAWAPDQLGIQSSVISCDIHDQPLSSNTLDSGCIGGPAYMCSSQQPWAVSDSLAYGFAAVNNGPAKCCQCYKLTFTGGPATGKVMIVQATNTGSDVGATTFDLAMPGGGFGMFDGCSSEWGATGDVWGQKWGGMMSNQCAGMPAALQPGCQFRWGSFFAGSDNVPVDWETVTCPLELTQKSGCVRIGDNPTPGSGGAAPPASTPVVPSAAPSAAPSAFSTVIVSVASTAVSIRASATIPSNLPVPSLDSSIPSFSIPSFSIPSLSIPSDPTSSPVHAHPSSQSQSPSVPAVPSSPPHTRTKILATISPHSNTTPATMVPSNAAAGVNGGGAPPGFTEIVFSVPHTLVTITVPAAAGPAAAAAMPWTDTPAAPAAATPVSESVPPSVAAPAPVHVSTQTVQSGDSGTCSRRSR